MEYRESIGSVANTSKPSGAWHKGDAAVSKKRSMFFTNLSYWAPESRFGCFVNLLCHRRAADEGKQKGKVAPTEAGPYPPRGRDQNASDLLRELQ